MWGNYWCAGINHENTVFIFEKLKFGSYLNSSLQQQRVFSKKCYYLPMYYNLHIGMYNINTFATACRYTTYYLRSNSKKKKAFTQPFPPIWLRLIVCIPNTDQDIPQENYWLTHCFYMAEKRLAYVMGYARHFLTH